MAGRRDLNNKLICAVREGRLESVRELINSYGLLYLQERLGGYLLLCDALENNHTAIAKLLLTSGAKVKSHKMNPSGSPLHFAAINGDVEVVRMILEKGAKIDIKISNGTTPLHYAIERKNMEVVELLLNHGADINCAQHLIVRTPLHGAVACENVKLIEFLLNCGADINCLCTETWRKGYSPLHFAVEAGNKEIITLLLNRGADVDVKGKDDQTPLHLAAEEGDESVVVHLLNHGACIHSLTFKKGHTPLHLAISAGHNTIVELLLKRGAYVDNPDKGGDTMLHRAVKSGDSIIVEEVLKYCPDIHNPCYKSILATAVYRYSGTSSENIQNLLQRGFIVNPEDANNSKLLHAAVAKGYFTIVQDLLKYGADVNSVLYNSVSKRDCTTPLHRAAIHKREEIAKLLISYGADINTEDEYGKTPMFYATESSKNLFWGRNMIHDCVYDSNSFANRPSEPTLNVFKRHIVKMKAANLYVNWKDSLRNINGEIRDFQNKCEVEIANTKSEKINNTNITFHDILTKDTNSLAMYTRNENIVSALESDEYKVTFPIYSDMIERNIRQGMEQQELLQQCNKVFHNLSPVLPDVCIDIILSYLSNEDLRMLTH